MSSEDTQIQVYQLTTGYLWDRCAPWLSLRVLKQFVEDQRYPLAIELICGRYVNDIFEGTDSIEQCQEVIQQINQICATGYFPLQKWVSISLEV